MISATVTVDTDILSAYQQAVQQYPRAIQIAFTDEVAKSADTLRNLLTQTPGKPSYPLRWARSRNPQDAGKKPNTKFGYYSRQKAAYFASNGFGAGIPYRRTGKLKRSWQVVANLSVNGGDILVSNTAPYSIYVQGFAQQPFHRDTGWRDAEKTIGLARGELQDRLITRYVKVVDDLFNRR